MCYSTKIQTFSPTKHPKWPLVHHGGIIIPLAMPRIAATSLLEQIFFSVKFPLSFTQTKSIFAICSKAKGWLCILTARPLRRIQNQITRFSLPK